MDLRSKRNIRQFDGDKYSVWKFRIRNLLSELQVLNVIDDEAPTERSAEWLKNNASAKNTIIEFLSDSLLGLTTEQDTAKQIFTKLDSIFERKSVATQLSLRKRLLNLKLDSDTKLIKHFQIFDEIVTELMAAGAKLEESDKVTHLFMTLPNSYSSIITAIETLTEDNITLTFVKTRLLDHEIKLTSEGHDLSLKVLQAETSSSQIAPSNVSRNHYQRKQKSVKPFMNNFKPKKCYYCGKKGHLKKHCFSYKRAIENKRTNNKTVQMVDSKPHDGNTSGFAFMTGNDTNDSNDGQNDFTFDLDSGAIAKNGAFIQATKKGNSPGY